jgi:lipopolysaccharide biosynthesis glycosyltransferase
MKKEIINIACSSDDNFAQHLCVVLFSLLKNLSSEREVLINILDGGISEENKEKIKDSLDFFKSKISEIRFILMEKAEFAEFRESKTITRPTYFRIILPSILSNFKKVIYLDCDLVIEVDISELYDMSLSGTFILAVRDSSIEMEKEYQNVLNIPNIKGYFNAGVLLINLEKFRQKSISNEIIKSLRKIDGLSHDFDQSSLNDVLYDRWHALSPEWNQLAEISTCSNYKNTTYTREEFFLAKNNPKIIHYSSRFSKPWLYESISPNKDRYLHYLKQTKFSDFKFEVTSKKIFMKYLYMLYFVYIPVFLSKNIFKLYRLLEKTNEN